MTILKHDTTTRAAMPDAGDLQHRSLARTGAIVTVVATAAVTAVTTFAKAQGVDFAIGKNGDVIPTAGAAVATAALCTLGMVLAVATRRSSNHPAKTLLRTTITLTAISLAPPLMSGGDAATVASLTLLHLIAAAVMIPSLARTLRP